MENQKAYAVAKCEKINFIKPYTIVSICQKTFSLKRTEMIFLQQPSSDTKILQWAI